MIKDFENMKQSVNTLMNSASKSDEEYQNLLRSMIKINEELTRNKLQIENSSDSIEKALYKMTHDLYSPLSNVEGLVNILKINGCYADENNKAIIDMIMDAVVKFKTRIKEAANFTSLLKANNANEWSQLIDVLELIKAKLNTPITSTNAIIKASFDRENNSLCYESNYCILNNLLRHALKNKADNSSPQIFLKSYFKDEFDVIEMEVDNQIDNKELLSAIDFTESTDVDETIHGLYIVKKIAEYAGGGLQMEILGNKQVVYKVFFRKG